MKTIHILRCQARLEQDILKGMCCYKQTKQKDKLHVHLLGSGTIFREVEAAADLLREDWGVKSDLWSCTSFTELAREGQTCERWNRLHPTETQKQPHVATCLSNAVIPVIAATIITVVLQSNSGVYQSTLYRFRDGWLWSFGYTREFTTFLSKLIAIMW
jgi:pyruvate dehydrogenase E1 component